MNDGEGGKEVLPLGRQSQEVRRRKVGWHGWQPRKSQKAGPEMVLARGSRVAASQRYS